MLVTAVSGTTFSVTRALESTAAAAHSSGASVTHILTAQSIVQAVNDRIVILGSIPPTTSAPGDSVVAGGAGVAAQADHLHGRESFGGAPPAVAATGVAGTATTLSRSDHAHAGNPMTTPGDVIVGGTAGVATRLPKGSDNNVLAIDPTTHLPVWAAGSDTFMTNPMTTLDDIVVGGASGSPTRLAKGSDGQVLTIDPTSHDVGWAVAGGGGSSMLARHLYAPGTEADYSTASSSIIDVDATNLALTFTAPTSTNVRIVATFCALAATNVGLHIALREGSSTIAHTERAMLKAMSSQTGEQSVTYEMVLLGISAGSHTYKLGYRNDSGTDFVYIYVDNGVMYGPATMIAYDWT